LWTEVVNHGPVDVAAVLRLAGHQTRAQIETLTAELADISASTDLVATDDEHDPEGATIAFERARVSALLAQARDHLAAVDTAERRVAAGTYGSCERCGRRISAARLAARPTAGTCIDCARS
jgi:RNA polymerase-binding transcription factor DksA